MCYRRTATLVALAIVFQATTALSFIGCFQRSAMPDKITTVPGTTCVQRVCTKSRAWHSRPYLSTILLRSGTPHVDHNNIRSRISRAIHAMWTNSDDRQLSNRIPKPVQDQKSGTAEVVDPVHPPPGSGSQVLVIGVAGGSGGGKSVFCTKLESMLEDICPTVVLSHDSYYKDKPEVDRDCAGNWDCPDALNTHDLVKDVGVLCRGETAEIPIYDFAANAKVQDASIRKSIPPGQNGVLLVEGLMCFHDEALRKNMDIRVYVDCDEDTRFMRRLARDTHPLKGRGRTVAQVYSAWARNVKPNHHRFVEPTKRFAHMIVPHHGVFADPGHLLAVGEDPTTLLDAYVNRMYLENPREAASEMPVAKVKEEAEKTQQHIVPVDLESEGHMWPALYMLQAYVENFVRNPDSLKSAAPVAITH